MVLICSPHQRGVTPSLHPAGEKCGVEDRNSYESSGVVDKLIAGKTGKPEGYYVGGIITTAAGLGLPFLGYFVGRIAPDYFFPIAGAGILVGLIGLSLIGGGMLLGRSKKVCKNGNQQS